MKPMSSLSLLALGLFASWQMLLLWGSVYILIRGLGDRRRIRPALQTALSGLLCLFNYALFQFNIGFTAQNYATPLGLRLVAFYAGLPAVLVGGVCLGLTAAEILLILSMRRWYNTHITSASIKETVETLPVGICAFEPDGKIILRNKTMEQLCRSLMGLPLLNGNEFLQMLAQKKADLADFAVSLPDYGVWSFTKDEIRAGGTEFTLLIAYNVTESYQKTQMLARRRETVQELNRKLLAYNRQMEQMITQQEILNAKVRIHDALGSGLLAIRHYLVSGGSIQERAELLERLRENIRFLQKEAVHQEKDEYALILSTAEALGVSVQISGILPQAEPQKHILGAAIHECFTNIIRHTEGDTLYVSITKDEGGLTARFTDNNPRPVGEIAETGGLRSLRDLTERAGGEMRIAAAPRYCLTIHLPKEAQSYGISGSDCG